MSATTVFEHHILRVQRLARLRAINRIFLMAACVFLCVYTALAIVSRIVDLPFEATLIFYGGLAAGAVAVATVYALITRTPMLSSLVEIDARLNLRDRLSTAYEYRSLEKPSEFRDLLVADAGRRLSKLHRRQLFPFSVSWLHAIILLAILLNATLFAVDALWPENGVDVPLNPQVSERIQQAIESYLKKNEAQEQSPDMAKSHRQELQQRLSRMARQLDRQTMTRNQAVEALQQNLKEIRSRQEQLTQQLGDGLKSLENIRELPVAGIPDLREFSRQQLNKMQKMLNQALGGELPPDMQEDLEALGEYEDMKEMLQDLENQLAEHGEDERGGNAAQQQREGGAEDSEQGEGMMSEQHAEYSDESSPDEMSSGDSQMAEQDIDGQRMQGIGGESSENQPDSRQPGRSKGDGQLNPPSPIERTATGPQQDRMAPSQRAEYKTYIRTVTTIGEAAVPEDDVERAYEREVERVLQKEDMPLNYRDYIKTYFLSIGLTNED